MLEPALKKVQALSGPVICFPAPPGTSGRCTFLFIGKNRQPDDKIQHCVQR
jgi:hypothetical protein